MPNKADAEARAAAIRANVQSANAQGAKGEARAEAVQRGVQQANAAKRN